MLLLVAAERGQPIDAEDVARVSSERGRSAISRFCCRGSPASPEPLRRPAIEPVPPRISMSSWTIAVVRQRRTFRERGSTTPLVAATILGRSAELLEVARRQGGTRWSEAAVALLSGEPQRAAELLAAMGAFDEAGARLAAAEALAEAGRQRGVDRPGGARAHDLSLARRETGHGPRGGDQRRRPLRRAAAPELDRLRRRGRASRPCRRRRRGARRTRACGGCWPRSPRAGPVSQIVTTGRSSGRSAQQVAISRYGTLRLPGMEPLSRSSFSRTSITSAPPAMSASSSSIVTGVVCSSPPPRT